MIRRGALRGGVVFLDSGRGENIFQRQPPSTWPTSPRRFSLCPLRNHSCLSYLSWDDGVGHEAQPVAKLLSALAWACPQGRKRFQNEKWLVVEGNRREDWAEGGEEGRGSGFGETEWRPLEAACVRAVPTEPGALSFVMSGVSCPVTSPQSSPLGHLLHSLPCQNRTQALALLFSAAEPWKIVCDMSRTPCLTPCCRTLGRQRPQEATDWERRSFREPVSGGGWQHP